MVIDNTGEGGLFDHHFEFMPNDAKPIGGASLVFRQNLFECDQLLA
jgi:hypothetical protein